MPRFVVRLEAQDGSGHFRETHLDAADKAAAKRHCERMELRRVLYELPTETILALAERYEIKVPKLKGPPTVEGLLPVLEALPKPAPLNATDEEKAAFRALTPDDRARVHAHFQTEPYKVVSVTPTPARGGA